MELTREEIEVYANGKADTYTCGKTMQLANQLLTELDKPGVWDGAPEWATKAVVNWSAPTHYSGVYKEYTRELPKSRARQIAEEIYNVRMSCGFEEGVNQIEAILKYVEENK